MPPETRSTTTAFARDVRQGLTGFPKSLPSRYIYDSLGDALFRKIMDMPEYYLTGCETEILREHGEDIVRHFSGAGDPFNLIELGAGDGQKTRILLRHLLRLQAQFHYMPVDISASALSQLTGALLRELPGLGITPREGTYFEVLQEIDRMKEQRKVILFLGSNIGNLLHPQAIDFLRGLRGAMGPRDLLLVGFDQKKDPATILSAYNDAAGITEAFNKNLLVRMNRELDADFDPDRFLHWEVYDPESGTARSYLVARDAHRARIGALDLEVEFRRWETIHVEISQKYDDAVVSWLAGESGLEIRQQYADSRGYYKDYLLGPAGGE